MNAQIFEDLTIIDLTMGWAGPLATMQFADFGARVVKVEGPGRLDWWRSGSASMPPADFSDPDERNWERSPLFNGVNRNKFGITLDMRAEEGRAVFEDLVAKADVVVESFSPRVMRKWGLEYERLRELNPEVIMMSLPGVGIEGPWSHYVGYASTTEALGGMPALCGYEDGGPRLQAPFVADPIGGLNGAVALALALYHRELTGEGQHIEVAQVEGMIPLIGSALMDYAMNGREQKRMGNGDEALVPNGVYPAEGDDRWVVVVAVDEEDWTRVCSAIDRPDLLDDPELSTPAGRLANRERIDQAVSEWTRRRSPREAMESLQSRGVMAGAVNTAADVLDDPQVAAADSLVEIEHPVVGSYPYPAVTVELSETPGTISRSAPMFGQHNDEILISLLDMSEAELDRLRESQIIVDMPVLRS